VKSNNKWNTIHRTPIDDSDFWNNLDNLINQSVNNQNISDLLTSWPQQNLWAHHRWCNKFCSRRTGKYYRIG
jgi:hypothetical protein